MMPPPSCAKAASTSSAPAVGKRNGQAFGAGGRVAARYSKRSRLLATVGALNDRCIRRELQVHLHLLQSSCFLDAVTIAIEITRAPAPKYPFGTEYIPPTFLFPPFQPRCHAKLRTKALASRALEP